MIGRNKEPNETGGTDDAFEVDSAYLKNYISLDVAPRGSVILIVHNLGLLSPLKKM